MLISVNHEALTAAKKTYRLQDVYIFLTESEIQSNLCKISIDLTYYVDILLVIQPYISHHLEECKDLAEGILDRINFERNQEETGILAMLGAATLIKEKSNEMIDNPGIEDFF